MYINIKRMCFSNCGIATMPQRARTLLFRNDQNFAKLRMTQLSLLSICVMTLNLGCSKSKGYETPETLIQVTGKVVIDGEPLTGATMNFIPDKGTSGTGGFAITDETGEFEALHYSQKAGLEPGTYKVTFSKLVMENGEPIQPGVDAADVAAVEKLPPHLSRLNPDNHQYLLTVNQSEQTIEYKLSSKRRRSM